MPSVPAEASPERGDYIRGVRIGDTEPGPVARIIVIGILLVLVAIAVALTVSAARQNSRADTLRHRGVPVQVTVTGCQAISSGVGMAIENWQCRGTYSLGGRSYNQVIGGSRALRQEGQIVPAVAVPGQPRLLSIAAAGTHSDWKPYIAPVVLGALVATSVLALLWWPRWRRHKATGAEAAEPPSEA